MLEYFSRDNRTSFGFVAADDLNADLMQTKPNKRFRFYRRMMLSIFGSETFAQGYDIKNSIYLLINRAMLEEGTISVHQIENEISKLYDGEYALDLDL